MDNLGPYNSGVQFVRETGMAPLPAAPVDRAEQLACARNERGNAERSMKQAIARVRRHRTERRRCVHLGLNDKYDAEQVIDALEDVIFWREQAQHYGRMVRKLQGEG